MSFCNSGVIHSVCYSGEHLVNIYRLIMTKNDKVFVSLWDLQDELPDEEIMWSYGQVRGAFEDEHPHNMVDACDAYVLTVYSFGRNDEHADDYETEDWETGMSAV